MAKVIISQSKAILPAFDDDKAEKIVKDVEMPNYIPDLYVSLDIGFKDLSVALFGWWDYEEARLVIQDEVVLKGNSATTDKIAKAITDKEWELWRSTPVYKRVCDTDPRLIEDLKKISNLYFRPTKKDVKEGQVNQTNIMLTRNQIVINPKCKTLIRHMMYGVWNDARTSFARTKALGHCDAIDALLYMVRNVDRVHNPIQELPTNSNTVWHGTKPEKIVSSGVASMRAAFKRR